MSKINTTVLRAISERGLLNVSRMDDVKLWMSLLECLFLMFLIVVQYDIMTTEIDIGTSYNRKGLLTIAQCKPGF